MRGPPRSPQGQSKCSSRPCPFLPTGSPSFLPSLQCPSSHTEPCQGLPPGLATSRLSHFCIWPWERVTLSLPPRPGPQMQGSIFPWLWNPGASLSPSSQGSWRAEAMTPTTFQQKRAS